MKKIGFIVVAVLAICIGVYPVIYFCIERTFGLLGSKTPELLSDAIWNAGFYTHILFGGLALLIGWIQFSESFRTKYISLHRLIGKVYVATVLVSALSGIYIGYFATGGWVSATGFIVLGIIWFYTTLMAYVYIKKKEVGRHKEMMLYSYAACFAAVTLRIWLPLLMVGFGDFMIAYRIVAWLCWVPNLVAVYVYRRL